MYNITELIPQRHPIIMVDEFLGMEENISKTRFRVRQDNMFVTDGILDECGLIEHIAQSAAARMGYLFKEKGEKVPLGYIGSINDFSVSACPRTGDEIVTTVEIIQEVFNISLIKACCKVNGACMATCKMKIFLDND